MGSVREEWVLCNLASGGHWLRLSRDRLGVSLVSFVLSKHYDRMTGLRDTQAPGGDRLLVHPSKSQFTSIQMYVTPR
jgi:hypothetical protein